MPIECIFRTSQSACSSAPPPPPSDDSSGTETAGRMCHMLNSCSSKFLLILSIVLKILTSAYSFSPKYCTVPIACQF